MIYKKTWTKYKFPWTYVYTGYFLFGFIPLYINRQSFK